MKMALAKGSGSRCQGRAILALKRARTRASLGKQRAFSLEQRKKKKEEKKHEKFIERFRLERHSDVV